MLLVLFWCGYVSLLSCADVVLGCCCATASVKTQGFEKEMCTHWFVDVVNIGNVNANNQDKSCWHHLS